MRVRWPRDKGEKPREGRGGRASRLKKEQERMSRRQVSGALSLQMGEVGKVMRRLPHLLFKI